MNSETMVLGQSRDKKTNVTKKVDSYDYVFLTNLPYETSFEILNALVDCLEQNFESKIDNTRLIRDIQTGKWTMQFTTYTRIKEEIEIDVINRKPV